MRNFRLIFRRQAPPHRGPMISGGVSGNSLVGGGSSGSKGGPDGTVSSSSTATSAASGGSAAGGAGSGGSNLEQDMAALLREVGGPGGDFTDITLMLDGQPVRAHKCILAARFVWFYTYTSTIRMLSLKKIAQGSSANSIQELEDAPTPAG